MTLYYDEGGITIYHGDCRDTYGDITAGYIPPVDAIVADPPYGIGWVPRVNHVGSDHVWVDDKQFDPREFLLIGSQHVFWGGNYFAHLLPPTEAWFVWNKRPSVGFENDKRSYATAELAWSDLRTKPRVKTHVWDGGLRQGHAQNRMFCHPAQKPVEIMAWCISYTTGVILDPFMGSGTTLVAAQLHGRRAIGIEIEERYCEIAAKRLSQSQGVLPIEQSA
jgi:site-specific DNA-methyltransferase (adenine-specific)